MNSKGFTTKELIISLFVLAIIVFYIIPFMTKKYRKAKMNEIQTYALRYIEAIEYYSDYLQINSEKIPVKKCVREKNAWKTLKCQQFYNEIEKQTSAKIPSNAIIELDSNGKVKYNSSFTYEGYKYIYK